MMPVDFGTVVFPGFGGVLGYICRWCDHTRLGPWSDVAWAELEMLERGSWPRRISDLVDGHRDHPNRCVLPQVDPPDNPV